MAGNTGKALGKNSRAKKALVKGWEDKFLDEFADCGVITTAAKKLGIHRNRVYERIKSDPEFARRFDEAEAECVKRLEDTAREMAFKEKHPTMVIFMLKCRAPERYRDRQTIEHTGVDNRPIEVVYVNDWRGKRDDEQRDVS